MHVAMEEENGRSVVQGLVEGVVGERFGGRVSGEKIGVHVAGSDSSGGGVSTNQGRGVEGARWDGQDVPRA